MATITIRNLPDEVRERLRIRAAQHGRSMEAEARAILTEAAITGDRQAVADNLQRWVNELYDGAKPTNVVDDLIAQRRKEAAAE